MELTVAEARALTAARTRDAGLTAAARKRDGVVHTPPELARFIARAVDTLLQRELGIAAGLADRSVSVIDPACGPGTFFAAVQAVAGHRAQRPRALLGLDRDTNGWRELLASNEHERQNENRPWPIALRCTDTLETDPETLCSEISSIVAVLGNPPWIGSAQPAPAPWLKRAIEELRRDEQGERLVEKKLGVLSDAYVRFLAWSVAVARNAADGAVLGLVTNSSYLDGPVHRGLRAVLRRTFDALYVIDLGGGALVAREGPADANVFGVRTPAAVLIGVRASRSVARAPEAASALAPVRYARVQGDGASKLEQLARLSLDDLAPQRLACEGPSHRFTPGRAAPPEYLAWPSLGELMPFHREGVQTNRDAAVIDASTECLVERLRAFAAGESRPELEAAERALAHYDPQRAREAVMRALAAEAASDGNHASWLLKIAYRPLDTRWFAALTPLCHRPRPDLLLAMQASLRAGGFALVTARKDRGDVPWRHIAAVVDAVDNSFLSTRSSCRARAVPTHAPDGSANLDLGLAAALFDRAGRVLSVHEVACYALARLSAPDYQATHGAWLRTDYPRVPLPRDAQELALALASGQRLRALWCEPDVELDGMGDDDVRADALMVGHQRVVERWQRGQRAEQRAHESFAARFARARARAAALERSIAVLSL